MDEGVSVVTKIPKITPTTNVSASGTCASGKLKTVAASMAGGTGVTSSHGLTSKDSPLDLIMSMLEAMEFKISGEYRQTPTQTHFYEDNQNNDILPYPSDHPDYYQYQQDLKFYDDEESLPLGKILMICMMCNNHIPHRPQATRHWLICQMSPVVYHHSATCQDMELGKKIFFLVFQNVIRLTNRVHVQ